MDNLDGFQVDVRFHVSTDVVTTQEEAEKFVAHALHQAGILDLMPDDQIQYGTEPLEAEYRVINE